MKKLVIFLILVLILISSCKQEKQLSPETQIFSQEENKLNYNDINLAGESSTLNILSEISTPEFEKDSYIIFFKEKPLMNSNNKVAENLNLNNYQKEKEVELLSNNIQINKKFKKSSNAFLVKASKENIEKIKDNQDILSIIPNYKLTATLDNSVSSIGADQVWLLQDSQGLNITGQGIKIAIIDTGIDYTHSDLGGCFGTTCKVSGGYDFINNDPDPMDDHGHGTHVASTAAGKGELNGVAPDATLYALKVLDETGSGYLDDLLESFEYLVDLNQNGIPLENEEDSVDIFSMSMGFPGGYPDDQVSLTVDSLVEQGLVSVSAAGNSGPNKYTIISPGNSRKTITVGAIDDVTLKLADFSSRGPTSSQELLIKPDIVTPGVDICAARYDSSFPGLNCLDNNHVYLSGTSMATPHVAGLAALILQAHPDWSPELVKASITSTAEDLGYNATDQGHGVVNALKAVDLENINSKVLESGISFGYVDQKNPENIMKNFTLINPSNERRVYSLQYLSTESCAELVFPREIMLEPSSSQLISVNLSLDNSCPENLIEGKILITSNEESITLPVLFYPANTVELNLKYDLQNLFMPPLLVIINSENKSSVFTGFINENMDTGESKILIIIDPSSNYDIFLITQNTYLTSNETLNNYSKLIYDSNITTIILDEVNITNNETLTISSFDWSKSIKYDPLLPNGESFSKTSGFRSTGGISFRTYGGFSFPFSSNSTYPEYNIELFENVTFLTNNIPEKYTLDYFIVGIDDNAIYLLQDRIGNPPSSIVMSNDPSEFIEKQIYFPSISSEDHAVINILTRYFSNNTKTYSIDKYLSHFSLTADNYLNTSINPLTLYNTQKPEDYLFEDLSIDFMNISNPKRWVNLGFYEFSQPLVSISNLFNLNQEELHFVTRIKSLDQDYIMNKVYSITENSNLQLDPVFIINRHRSNENILDFDSFLSSQSGDLPYRLSAMTFNFYQEGVDSEMTFSYWASSNVYINDTNSALLDIYPNFRNLDLSRPMTIQQSAIGFGNIVYTTNSTFYFDPANEIDNIPPVLIDVDILNGTSASNNLVFPNGTFRFTIADDNLESIKLTINNQEVQLIAIGNPYSVRQPENIFYDTQFSWFESDFTNFVFIPNQNYEVSINASDISSNWMTSTFFINMNSDSDYSINLQPGYNFISAPNDQFTKTSFNSNSIMYYNSELEHWFMNYKEIEQIQNITPCNGYIIESTSYISLPIEGTFESYCDSLTPNSWNLVGTIIEGTVNQNYGPGQYTVMEWNGNSYSDISSEILQIGKAYWVYPGIPQSSPPRPNS
nr:hypothetical protein [Nanoarchaeum sp.]